MSKFSDFIRNASDEERHRVYLEVMEAAEQRQRAVLSMGKYPPREQAARTLTASPTGQINPDVINPSPVAAVGDS